MSLEERDVTVRNAVRKHSLELDAEDVPSIESRTKGNPKYSNGYLVLLSLGFAGLQTVFALLASNGTSYLIHLGMRKSLLGLTWLAGPVAGALLQPYVGLCSDKCRSRWGRRRPYILGGSLAIILATVLLAQTSELASVLACLIGVHGAEHAIRMVLAALAVISISCGIQPVQVGLRALIVDKCPSAQQLQANAWAARATGAGNIFCFLIGTLDLPAIVPALRDQFNALSLVTCMCLGVTTGITCLFVREDSTLSQDGGRQAPSVAQRFREIFECARDLPTDIRTVCIVQFFSWMGWFPFLFYISTYASETYLRRLVNSASKSQDSVPTAIWDDATRQGSATMLIFAIVSFVGSALLPAVINSTRRLQMVRSSRISTRWMPAINLRSTWTASHVLFGLCLIVPGLFDNGAVIKVCAGLIGISWACTIWIPFALISTSIAARNSRAFIDAVEGPLRLEPATVLALHNVALSVPQALTACLSSFVFWISNSQQRNSIPLVLGIGGLSGFAAAWATRSLKTEAVVENAVVEESILLVPGNMTKTNDCGEDIHDDSDF